jgi:hypothetical protein
MIRQPKKELRSGETKAEIYLRNRRFPGFGEFQIESTSKRYDLNYFDNPTYLNLVNGLINFDTPQTKIPQVDHVPIIKKILQNRDRVPEKYLMNIYLKFKYITTGDTVKVLKELLPNGQEDNIFFSDGHYTYYLQNCKVNGCYYSKGVWHQRNTSQNSSNFSGSCILSMITFIIGCNNFQAIKYVMKILHFNVCDGTKHQPYAVDGYNFVENSSAYPSDGVDQVVKEITVQIFETTDESYIFCNQFGKPSFKLIVWRETGWPPVYLFQTKQLLENGRYLETMIAPPWSKIIYNNHLILEQKEAVIIIHDDIGRIIDWAEPGVNTWSGEIEYTGEIDWSVLKGRSVCYVFDLNCPASCKIGNKLNDICSHMDVMLEFIAVY